MTITLARSLAAIRYNLHRVADISRPLLLFYNNFSKLETNFRIFAIKFRKKSMEEDDIKTTKSVATRYLVKSKWSTTRKL